MITRTLKPGDKVSYLARPGAQYEHGVVKSLHPTNQRMVFVVYKCNGNWANYQNYTAACTDTDSLMEGWL